MTLTPARHRARPERSRTLRVLATLAAGHEKMSALSARGRPPVRPVDRDLPVVVAEVRDEADGVVSLRLVAADRAVLPAWRPGAHLDLVLPSGRLRQYSLCGDPGERSHWQIAVRRIADGGGGSREVHQLRAGARVVVRGPRNAFPFVDADRYLFVAGGIGITPIRPMLREALDRGADWSLVYTGSTRAAMPFLDELSALDARRVHIRPDDEYGVPDTRTILAAAPHAAALYCCGPPPMIEAIRAELPDPRIATVHSERFSPPRVLGGRAFEIVLAGGGEVVAVGPDQSALAAVRAVRPDLAYSCQQGFCGTCPVPLLDGTVEHHDRCLTDTERAGSIALCVSRGSGRITVDL